jgi:glycosyltransferase involved in cell wall biosynthesis
MPPTAGEQRVLFVSHQATLTGAPMMLLHLIRWVRANTDIVPTIVLLRGGPLESEFRALGPTYVVPSGTGALLHRLEAGLEYLGFDSAATRVRNLAYRPVLRRARKADVVYLNCITSFGLAPLLKPGPRVIAHVHELDMGLRGGTKRWLSWPQLIDRVDLFIAAADCVADTLQKNWGVPPDRVVTHHEFIDVRALTEGRKAVTLPVPDGAPVVGGCGVLEWRKGADLLVHLAAAVHKRRDDVQFVWVGASQTREAWALEHEIHGTHLEDHVHLIETTPDAISYLAAFDVFALTSREDPFPLVALESSALGVPVVSFDNGGMREFLSPSCGRLVPYLDVEAMADAVLELIEHPDTRAALGAEARETVIARHDVNVAAPFLWRDVMGLPVREDVDPPLAV